MWILRIQTRIQCVRIYRYRTSGVGRVNEFSTPEIDSSIGRRRNPREKTFGTFSTAPGGGLVPRTTFPGFSPGVCAPPHPEHTVVVCVVRVSVVHQEYVRFLHGMTVLQCICILHTMQCAPYGPVSILPMTSSSIKGDRGRQSTEGTEIFRLE
ncbi:hypothetical protein QE152_g248 [Popillia japonica]|uniref:Uncharacterized protein n=1 Tax=Popillia japonica TaxID=7064 RepID=A0AAW1NKB3_POPJA